MAKRTETREELKERVAELEGENESLQDQLDAIADIVVPAEEEEEAEEQDEEDSDSPCPFFADLLPGFVSDFSTFFSLAADTFPGFFQFLLVLPICAVAMQCRWQRPRPLWESLFQPRGEGLLVVSSWPSVLRADIFDSLQIASERRKVNPFPSPAGRVFRAHCRTAVSGSKS